MSFTLPQFKDIRWILRQNESLIIPKSCLFCLNSSSYIRLSFHSVKSRLCWWEVKCAVVVTGEQMSSNKPLPQPTPGGTQKHHKRFEFIKQSFLDEAKSLQTIWQSFGRFPTIYPLFLDPETVLPT